MENCSDENRPKISIVTVVKKPDLDFGKTAQSIIGQNYSDFEWIIKCCGEFPKKQFGEISNAGIRIKILETDDRGIYDAMNQGLDQVSGEYVYFLNSGDVVYSPDTLQRIAKVLKAEEPNIVYGSYEIASERVIYPRILTRFFFLRTALCHQAYFIRTNLLKGIGGYNLRYEVLADQESLLRLQGPIIESHYNVRFFIGCLKPMGFSNEHKEKKLKERRLMVNEYYSWNTNFRYRFILGMSLQPLRSRLLKLRLFVLLRRQILKYLYR